MSRAPEYILGEIFSLSSFIFRKKEKETFFSSAYNISFLSLLHCTSTTPSIGLPSMDTQLLMVMAAKVKSRNEKEKKK